MSKCNGVVLLEYTVAVPVAVFTGAALIASLMAHPPIRAADAYCMTTLNALNKSALVYCEMSRGFLMPYTHAPVPGTELTEAAPSADHTAVCFAAGAIDPMTRLLADRRNYGYVYALDILRPAEMFYCPQQKQTPYVLKDYPKPWGSAVPEGSQYIFCGYMFNPWVKAASTEGRQFIYEYGLSLEKYPPQRPLVGDLMLGPATIAHHTRGQPVWNMGFADGHVEGVRSEALAQLFQAQAETDWNSWEHWGALSADGQEPGTGTVRYEVVNILK